jgi:hypothetical protein
MHCDRQSTSRHDPGPQTHPATRAPGHGCTHTTDANRPVSISADQIKWAHPSQLARNEATAKRMSSASAKRSACDPDSDPKACARMAVLREAPEGRRSGGGTAARRRRGGGLDVGSTHDADEEVEEHLWGGRGRVRGAVDTSSILLSMHDARGVSNARSRELARAPLRAAP